MRALYDPNVFGVMNVTRAVLLHMRRRKRGVVVNVTSMAGLIGLPVETGYSSAKWAIEGFSEGLAFECKGFGIQVKTVAPGATCGRSSRKTSTTPTWRPATRSSWHAPSGEPLLIPSS